MNIQRLLERQPAWLCDCDVHGLWGWAPCYVQIPNIAWLQIPNVAWNRRFFLQLLTSKIVNHFHVLQLQWCTAATMPSPSDKNISNPRRAVIWTVVGRYGIAYPRRAVGCCRGHGIHAFGKKIREPPATPWLYRGVKVRSRTSCRLRLQCALLCFAW